MSIQVLPNYMINRLKAGEVVERPASIVKELIENALDAQASHITLTVDEGGKTMIKVEDDGVGIKHSDAAMVLERYATSKIKNEDDLHELATYGFRGEALSSIAEVAKVTMHTKTQNAITATKIWREQDDTLVNTVPVPFDRGTSIMVEDVFYNTPARQKYLKSKQTEYFYSYQLFLNFALVHYQLRWTLIKNGRTVLDLKPTASLHERIKDVYKKDRSDHLIDLDMEGEMMSIKGVIGDPTLRFGTADNMKIFVNSRPVKDRIIKKAIMKAFERQIVYGEHPLAIIFLDIRPGFVDVNVHPRKTEVKFIDPGAVFNRVNTVVREALAGRKITSWNESHGESKRNSYPSYGKFAGAKTRGPQRSFTFATPGAASKPGAEARLGFDVKSSVSMRTSVIDQIDEGVDDSMIDSYYSVVGQVRDSYIVLQSSDGLYYIDQHALAERINFEKMRKDAKENKLTPTTLLQPLTIEVIANVDQDEKCDQLNDLGFDCSLIGENKIAVYAVPKLFADYKVDIEKLLDKVLPMEEIDFDGLIDLIYAMRACRASIKAGDKLSLLQMQQLIKDGFEHIDGMFVCQHGRPFFVKVDKLTVDKMFERA